MEKHTKPTMGNSRKLRFHKDVEDELQKIADANGVDLATAIRMATRVGMPILKKRLCGAVKQAA